MKKNAINIIALFALLFAPLFAAAQATAFKPTMMVIPARDWCKRNGYTTADGTVDYTKALENQDMLNAIIAMADIMAGENYPMLSLQALLDDLHSEGAYDMLLQSKGDGQVMEDDVDRLARVARADIMIEMSLDRQRRGPSSYVEFRLASVDAASGKIIHGETGASSSSAAPMPVLLKEAVTNFMPNFYNKIDIHFTSLENNGREGTVIFKIADDCPVNMESEVSINGESGELAEFLDYWMSENCVNGAYSPNGKSRVRMAFNQVRIPLFGKAKAGGFGSKSGKMKALDAESFIKGIEKPLRSMGISISTTPIGVGKVLVVLGGA